MKNNLLILEMICGERSGMVGGEASEGRGMGGDGGGPVNKMGGENGASSFMKLQCLSSFLHRYGSNLSFNSARVGQWKSL